MWWWTWRLHQTTSRWCEPWQWIPHCGVVSLWQCPWRWLKLRRPQPDEGKAPTQAARPQSQTPWPWSSWPWLCRSARGCQSRGLHIQVIPRIPRHSTTWMPSMHWTRATPLALRAHQRVRVSRSLNQDHALYLSTHCSTQHKYVCASAGASTNRQASSRNQLPSKSGRCAAKAVMREVLDRRARTEVWRAHRLVQKFWCIVHFSPAFFPANMP